MDSSTQRLVFKAGEAIFAEDDAPTTAFLIESGRVVVSTIQHGERRELGELAAGALLGEMAVIDSAPRSASAHALTDCVLIAIDRNQFAERLAAADPVVRALLMSQLTRYRSALATLTGDVREQSLPTKTDDSGAFDKIRLESELRAALQRDELEVRLQPLMHIPSNSDCRL